MIKDQQPLYADPNRVGSVVVAYFVISWLISQLCCCSRKQMLAVRCVPQLSFNSWGVKHCRLKRIKLDMRRPSRVVLTSRFLVLLLLILACDVQPNPGPSFFPCSVCSLSVSDSDEALLCDGCGLWSHRSCNDVDEVSYHEL